MILKRHQTTVSIIEQADWISKESPDLAFSFLKAVDQTFSLLEKNPKRLPKRLLTHFA